MVKYHFFNEFLQLKIQFFIVIETKKVSFCNGEVYKM